jgi:hypothetical protein
MARASRHSLFEALSGALGKEIVFKQYKDKTVISKYPDMSKVKASEGQKAQRALLTEATEYASRINRDVRLRVAYQKKIKKDESVYRYAIKEFFEKRRKS